MKIENIDLLKPMNQCQYTSIEKSITCLQAAKHTPIKAYMDNEKGIRITLEGMSVLWLEKDSSSSYVIRQVYTAPDCRMQYMARDLLMYARIVLGLIVNHSEHNTQDGIAWAKRVS